MTASAILELLEQQYHASDVFDIIDVGRTTGVYYSLKRSPEATIICLRGSVDPSDWFRDALAVANPFSHNFMGPVHAGFMKGVEDAWAQIKSRSKPPYIIAGHSLGAARAALMAGLMKHDGLPPIARYGFGEPHPGTMKLRVVLASIPAEVYRTVAGTAVDHVTEVPLPNIIHYVPSAPFIDIPATPQGSGPFALHHVSVYKAALEAAQGA